MTAPGEGLVTVAVDQTITIDRDAGPIYEDCNLDFVPDELQIAANPNLDLDGNVTETGTLFKPLAVGPPSGEADFIYNQYGD